MKVNHYARKKRQLKFLLRKYKDLIAQGITFKVGGQLDEVINKIKSLVNFLKPVIGQRQLKSILSTSLFVSALSIGTNAQSFGEFQQNPFGITTPMLNDSIAYYFSTPAFADIDNDGDYDMMSGFRTYIEEDDSYVNEVFYYENIGTAQNPNFAAPEKAPFGIVADPGLFYVTLFNFLHFEDMDNDGDHDIVSAPLFLAPWYYENTGSSSSPEFGEPDPSVINLEAISDTTIFTDIGLADLDNDGDIDLISAVYDPPGLVYYENTGNETDPTFTLDTENLFLVQESADSEVVFYTPSLVDLDSDGDMDLVVSSFYEGLRYYENIGSASSFEIDQLNFELDPFNLGGGYSEYLLAQSFVDIDADGDLDFFSGSYYGVIGFQENDFMSNDDEVISESEVVIFPNPTSDVLNIKTKLEFEKIEIFNLQGQLLQEFNDQRTDIDLSQYKVGSYFAKFTNDEGHYVVKEFQKM